MYSNYKIVACTAAGRMCYMQYIFPYILSNDIIDRYDIWVNTTNMKDIESFKWMANYYSKIHLIYQPDGIVSGVKSINAFYKTCMETDTIYIKIDDDIVWMQPDIIENMVSFRIAHPEAFLVTPLVINNPMSTYIWQVKGLLNYGKYMNIQAIHRSFWKRGAAALKLHNHFLDNMEKDANFYKKLYTGTVPQGCCRFSINFILWFGKDMAYIHGEIPGDDEEYLSSILAPKLGKINYFNGNSLVAHFSFAPQRMILDKTRTMERYGNLCKQYFLTNEKLKTIWQEVQQCRKEIETITNEINKMPCPYPIIQQPFAIRMKKTFKKYQKLSTYYYEKWKGVRYLVQEGDIFSYKHKP